MGNKVQLPHFLSHLQSTARQHSYQQLKDKVNLINSAFQEIHQQLLIHLELLPNTINYQSDNWKKTTIRAKITLTKTHPQTFNENPQQPFTEHILLSYEDVNLLHEEMKNLHSKPNPNANSNIKTPSQTPLTTPSSELSDPTQFQTPQRLPATQEEECCICLQKTPSMVLPCSHAFCDDCTVKYIIEADEKKCPQCRQEIKGSRESVEKQIFTLVQDEQVFEQIRFDVLQVLKNLNPRVAKNAQEFLALK